jgi:hypothetical protein
VQFEFPWVLGPEPGRYTIRERLGEAPAHILVLRTLGAPERRLALRRGARAAPSDPPPTPVQTSRATLVDTTALEGREAAEQRLRDADVDALAGEALARLNRVLHAHRVAVADAHVREVAREQALVVRVGYGDGERVADGRWDSARELPAVGTRGSGRGARGRSAALRPQERLAAVLAGRDAVLAGEELTLRARSDLDAGRMREAALQLRVAFEATLAELEPWRDMPGLDERLHDLRGHRDEVAAAANAALRGGLDPEHIATVKAVLPRVEAALRARTAGERL